MKTSKNHPQDYSDAQWQCISGCGACCNLTPAERPELDQYLSAPELEQYLAMVGPDGWCINYDKEQRNCRIYQERPRFCRVESQNFHKMYGVEPSDFQQFAIACCQQQIKGVYGQNSRELELYNRAVEPRSEPI